MPVWPGLALSHVYGYSNLWRAFICSIFCVVAFELINAFKVRLPSSPLLLCLVFVSVWAANGGVRFQDDELFADTHFRAVAHSGISWELIAFSILGVLCGVRVALPCAHVSLLLDSPSRYPCLPAFTASPVDVLSARARCDACASVAARVCEGAMTPPHLLVTARCV